MESEALMIQIIFWVLLALCSALGMALIPIYPATGCIVAVGCFLILAFDIARQFV